MPERGFLHGRRVMVVDGTGVSMPDTQANQAASGRSRASKRKVADSGALES